MPEPENMPEPHLPNDANWLDAGFDLMTALAPLGEALSQKGQAIQALRDNLIRLLSLERLKAYGYVVPRDPDDAPRSIPPDVWSGEIDWKLSGVTGQGLSFVSVRVISSKLADEIRTRHVTKFLPELKRRQGRPSKKAVIVEAFDALVDGGMLDPSKPMTVAANQVRRWLAERYPHDAARMGSLHDETIRRAIASKFKTLKKSTKQ